MHVSSLFQPRQQRECVVCRVTPPRLARQPNEEYLEQAGVLGSWAGPLSGAVAARCRMLLCCPRYAPSHIGGTDMLSRGPSKDT